MAWPAKPLGKPVRPMGYGEALNLGVKTAHNEQVGDSPTIYGFRKLLFLVMSAT